MKVLAIIPARLGSSRLSAKVLRMIQNKSLIQRVYENVLACPGLSEVVVAVDHPSVFDHVISFGGKAVMTSDGLLSGTDRCAAVSKQYHDFPLVVNVQGDEPFIGTSEIQIVIQQLQNLDADIASLMVKMEDPMDLNNPNVVKVVCKLNGEAMYFSRSAIPYNRSFEMEEWVNRAVYWRHIGIYGFKRDTLLQITNLPESKYEGIEKLEQLRWLESGYRIKMGIGNYRGIGIDTEDDLKKAEEILSK
ncbi:MAG: 3-deoxy-manno-octulosonate cytidylyltransferase [Saprospiraceae bacterium]|nr:3-deoxy-manno-octulosonate cytidylyltransferase [Saprospiraceae bacterium]